MRAVTADQAPILVDAARDVEFNTLALRFPDRARKYRAGNRLGYIRLGDVVESDRRGETLIEELGLGPPSYCVPFCGGKSGWPGIGIALVKPKDCVKFP
jgi:hypothetical protein